MGTHGNQNGISGDTLLAEVPLTLSAAAQLASALHGSLQLAEILRGLRRFLQGHYRIGRLSLVQHRSNESTATLYSLDDNGESSLIGPRVIALEPSRLRQCLARPAMQLVASAAVTDHDRIEQRYLLGREAGLAVYAPLLLEGRLKGILVLDLPRRCHLIQAQKALLSYVADQLALAIEGSDRHYLECRRSRQLEMVSEIARRAVRVDNLDAFLQEAAQLIRVSFDYHAVQIWTAGSAQDELLLRASACKAAREDLAAAPIPWMVSECRNLDQTLCDNSISIAAVEGPLPDPAASRMAVPVRLRGKLLGVLHVESTRLDSFPAEDLSTMEGVASLIAATYDNLRAFEHAQQSNEYMQAILESAKDLAILSTDTQGVVITSSVGSEALFYLSSRQVQGASVLTLFTDHRFREELSTYIHSTDSSILERKRLRQSRNGKDSYLDVTVQSVHDPDKLLIGFLCIVQDVTENVRLQERLESLSITDELTGLFNRRRFFSALAGELERARRYRRRLSLCFFDLDGFKKFNDLKGHRTGDRALKEAADLVMASIRSGVDSCYRYGGDEFIIVMPETVKSSAQVVAERVRAQLREHFRGEISASIGIAESTAQMDAERLLEKADKAMYQAKSLGGDQTILAD